MLLEGTSTAMLDDSIFEDIHEIAENTAYIKAVEEKEISTEMLDTLPPYEELRSIEETLESEGRLRLTRIFNEPTGAYLIRCFMNEGYSVDKAWFVKDVQYYRKMRFLSARQKVARLIYQRYVEQDSKSGIRFQGSIFEMLKPQVMEVHMQSYVFKPPYSGPGSAASASGPTSKVDRWLCHRTDIVDAGQGGQDDDNVEHWTSQSNWCLWHACSKGGGSD